MLVNGPREELMRSPQSVTAGHLRGELGVALPRKRRKVNLRTAVLPLPAGFVLGAISYSAGRDCSAFFQAGKAKQG